MANSRKLKVNLILGLQGKGVDEAIKDVQKLGKNIQGLSGTAIKAAAAFAVFKGGRLFGEFARDAVDDATQLERNIAAIGSIFGETAPAMLEFSQNASRIGLNMNEAAGAATFLGSVIKQAGFDIEETSEMTKTLLELSADLAITYNRDVSEALNAVAALFRGEYDPIEKFGVGMKQNEIESLKAARGLDKLTGRAEIFADVMVRYEQLLIRANDAQGAFERQADSLYVQQQVLAATFENVRAAVGLGLTPALSRLTAGMIPLAESLGPVLIQVFDSLIPLIESMTVNKDRLAGVLVTVLNLFGGFIEIVFRATAHIIDHINVYKNLAIAFGAIVVGTKLFGLLTTGIGFASTAANILNIQLSMTNKQLMIMKARIAATGFGLIAIGVGAAAVALGVATDDLDESVADLDGQLEEFDLSNYLGEVQEAQLATSSLGEEMENTAGAAGQLKDAVGDFYRNLENEAAKQSAKLQLEALGASEGLINAVLGSGEEWFKVFADVTRRGAESIREVQALFAATPAGFDELQQEIDKARQEFEAFQDAANGARDSLMDFVREFEVLPSVEKEMGQFERAVSTQLEGIEERLQEAFDNGYLLESSFRQLRDYARREFQVLREIERQRDALVRRRNAAEQLINQVTESVSAGGKLIGVLRDVQDETEQIDMTRLVKQTIQEADGLREFEVILTSAVVDPITEVVSKSQQLVNGYRDIVARTRVFVENMKALRQLGLDPTLFNELVEAGVDAGGETAQALVDGGAKTVNEVNSLFGELNKLGAELGEETAQVMYGQGEMFVDGIVNGLEAQASQLEEQAIALAGAFTSSFEALLISGIEIAIAKAELALGKMPTLEGMPSVSSQRDTATTITTADGKQIPAFATPETVEAMVNKRRKEVEDMRRVAQQQAAAARAQAQADAMVRKAREKSGGAVKGPGTPDRRTPSQQNIVINSSSRADGASVAKTISGFSYKNTTRVSDSWQRRTLRAF